MKKKFLLIIALTLLMVLALLPCTAQAAEVDSGSCGSRISWYLDNEGTLTIHGRGPMRDYGSYYSTVPAPWHKNRGIIQSVVIEGDVTSIGECAFDGCSALTSVEIPEGVTSIGKSAFDGCSALTSVEIPEGVTSIGKSAFYGCSALTSVEIPSSVTSIGSSAFCHCKSLTSVEIPSSVTSIGESTFYFCSALTSVEIPSSVTSIGECAFSNCNGLKKVYISDLDAWKKISFGDIYANPLRGNAKLFFNGKEVLTSGSCGSNVDWVIFGDGILELFGSGAMTDYTSAFAVPWYSSRKKIIGLKIADGITSVGDYSFKDCTSLTSISIPDSVSRIGKDAFAGCSALKNVYISNFETWTNISFGNEFSNPLINGGNIYYNGNIITDVVSMGDYGSNVSWRLYTDGTLELTGSGMTGASGAYLAWQPYVDQIKKVKISEGIVGIGQLSFEGCTQLVSVEIPTTVVAIGPDAFNKCTSLSEVHVKDLAAWNKITFNSSKSDPTYYGATLYLDGTCGENVMWSLSESGTLTISGSGAMDDYSYESPGLAPWTSQRSKIKKVIIEDGVTSIGAYAFAGSDLNGCPALTSITIPGSVKTIGYSAFWGCSSLTSVVIPEGVTSIKGYAFSDCSALRSITLPNSLQSIEMCAFSDCMALKDVYVDDFTAWSNIQFDGDLANPLYYGAKLHWNGDLVGTCGENVTWTLNSDNGLLTISGSGAMTNYDSLNNINAPWHSYSELIKSVKIENGVTSVGDYAFEDCVNLTSVSLPQSMKKLGAWAFSCCSNITSITVPDSITEIGRGAFIRCAKLKSVNIPNSVTVIDDHVFGGCSSLASITIPSGVTSIGGNAFADCTSLKSLTLPQGVTDIWEGAFMGCTNLTSINLPKGLKIIKASAFMNCEALTSIVIPDGVEEIEYYAFSGCTALKSATIPASVKTIGDYSLDTEDDMLQPILKDVYYGGSPSQWKKINIGRGNFNLSEYGKTTIYYAKTDLLGDINGDGKVNNTDFNLFRLDFGKNGDSIKNPLADINDDKKVNNTDFNLFRQNFGKSVAN